MRPKTQPVMVRLTKEQINRMDRYAHENKLSRSGAIQRAVEEFTRFVFCGDI